MADHHQSLPPQETLAVMNSHLGRFLVQADELIQECRSFGESLRTSLEAELDKLNDTVAHTLDSAAQRTAEQAGARFAAQLETALGGRLAELRQKLDDMSRLADRAAAARADTAPAPPGGPALSAAPGLPGGLPVTGTAVAPPARRAAPAQPWPRGLTVLVATANLMLAALLVLMLLDMRGDRGGDSSAGPGGAAAGTDPAPGGTGAAGTGATGAGTTGTGATGTGAAAAGAAGTSGNASPDVGPDVGPGTGPGAQTAGWAELCQPLAESADPAKAHALVAAAAAAACGDRAGAVTANVLAGVRTLPAPEGKIDGKPQTPAPAEKPSRGTKSRSREQKP